MEDEKYNLEKTEARTKKIIDNNLKEHLSDFVTEITHGLIDEEKNHITTEVKKVPEIFVLLNDKEHFVPGKKFFCSNEGVVEYIESEMDTDLGKLKLLHEYCHKVFSHTGKVSDHEALKNERVAWFFAIETFEKFWRVIDDGMITSVKQMFNTYEKFILEKSICPSCGTTGSEFAPQKYTCENCYTDW